MTQRRAVVPVELLETFTELKGALEDVVDNEFGYDKRSLWPVIMKAENILKSSEKSVDHVKDNCFSKAGVDEMAYEVFSVLCDKGIVEMEWDGDSKIYTKSMTAALNAVGIEVEDD